MGCDLNGLLLLLRRCGLLLHAVARAALLTAVNAEAVKRAANDVVSNTGEIANATAANEHDGVLLKIVAFAADVGSHFVAVRQPNAAHLAERGVRLFRRNSAHL